MLAVVGWHDLVRLIVSKAAAAKRSAIKPIPRTSENNTPAAIATYPNAGTAVPSPKDHARPPNTMTPASNETRLPIRR